MPSEECQSIGCHEPATQAVHWATSDLVDVYCDEHADAKVDEYDQAEYTELADNGTLAGEGST